MISLKDRKVWQWLGLIAVAAFAAVAAIRNGARLFGVSDYDSYALQALAWRSGMMHLPGNVPHLELAIFNGNYYVSFPPIPTIPVWLLQWAMPNGAPSGLLAVIYYLLCYPAAYGIARRYLHRMGAATLAACAVCGGSFLDVAVSGSVFSGGVWYQAQTLGMLTTLCAFYGVGRRGAWRFTGWLSIALSVGCRPFQAMYIPYLVWMQWETDHTQTQSGIENSRINWFVTRVLPHWIAPMMVATALGWYNWARFGSPLEFGHNYLPEFNRPGQVQFSLNHIVYNLFRILRPPFVEYRDGFAVFPITLGFAVYFTNPMLTDAGASLIRRRLDTGDCILLVTLIVHMALLLMHRTFGGWQYGTRYVCDMIPGLLMLRLRSRNAPGWPERAFLMILAGCNLAGTIAFHVLSGM